MIRDIVACFFKVFYPGIKPNYRQFEMIAKQAENLLKKGWTYTNITNRIINAFESGEISCPDSLYKVVPMNQVPPLLQPGNILKNQFYYHNRLQITSGPTEVIIDEDGNIIKKAEPFFLEIIEYFSIEDLTSYFHNKMEIKDSNLFKLNNGGFKKIINNYSLDLLLFTIDAAFFDRKDKKQALLTNYSELYQYLSNGQSLLNGAKNSSTGKIVPRFRAYLKRRDAIYEKSHRRDI